jgi:hypothetical protein
LGTSTLDEEREVFTRELTTNKLYWGGMGTIADLIMPTPELELRFVSAYLELARACDAAGCASIYSKDIESNLTKALEYWRKRIEGRKESR